MKWIDKMPVPNMDEDREKRNETKKDMDSEADRDCGLIDKKRQVLYEDFLDIIRDLIDVAHKIAQVEEEKAVAVSQKHHELLDGFMKREQAGILKLRGLDQHRMQLAKRLGWDSLTFSQILEEINPVQQEYFKMLFLELEQELMRLIESKELAERIINVRIYELLITVERKAGIPYDNTRTVNLDECSHVNLCDRYI